MTNVVWHWFCVAGEAVMPVSGPMVHKGALQIALKLDVTEFTAMSR